MPGPKLRRYDICKKFHASYFAPDFERGKGYLRYSCWKARFCYNLAATAIRRD